MTHPARLLLWAALVAAAGCSDRGPRVYQVTGTVTYLGKPVPYGNLRFEPDGDRGNAGPGAATNVVDGRFATQPKTGVVGGPYLITVIGYDGKQSGEEPGVVTFGRALFPTYTVAKDFPVGDSELAIEVPPGGRAR